MRRINVNGSEIRIYGVAHSSSSIFADFYKLKIEKMVEEELYDIVLIEGYADEPFHKLTKEKLADLFKDFHIHSLVENGKIKEVGIIDPAIESEESKRAYYPAIESERAYFSLAEIIYFLLTIFKRDDFMSIAIKNVAKYYKKILVIVGEAHEKSIYKRLKGDVKVDLWEYYYEYMKKLNEGKVNYGAIIYSIKEDKARVIPYYPFLREFELKNGLD